jgi:hypothetical protein
LARVFAYHSKMPADVAPLRGARTAIVYDFDGTLARGNIQEHTFLPELGLTKDEFWAEVGRLKQKHNAD